MDLRYPIGKYQRPEVITPEDRRGWIEDVARAPGELRAVVARLTPAQLDLSYRPEGWTARQVIHHIPDSHTNAYIRFKLALTESTPTIKPYREELWAELADSRVRPIDVSLRLLEAVHERWLVVLRNMSDADFRRGFLHPEHGRVLPLEEVLALYSWHGRHHTAHVRLVADGRGVALRPGVAS